MAVGIATDTILYGKSFTVSSVDIKLQWKEEYIRRNMFGPSSRILLERRALY